MKIPVFLPVTREFGLRDEFAQDCLLQRRVMCEPDSSIREQLRLELRPGQAPAAIAGVSGLPVRLSGAPALLDRRGTLGPSIATAPTPCHWVSADCHRA